MAKTIVRGSTTVKRLRQGDTLTSLLLSTKSLVQYINKTNNKVNPDWTQQELQPIIYPSIRSNLSTMFITGGNITNAKWFYDGVEINTGNPNFTLLNHNALGGTVPGLKIIGNIMENTTTGKTIRLECNVTSGGAVTPVIATIDVQRQEVSETTYVGEISAKNGGSITEDNNTETLSGILMRGGQIVPKYDIQWWRIVGFDDDGNVDGMVDTGKRSNETTPNVTFGANEIHLFETIVAKFFVDNVEVAMASIDIIDLTDPYEMRFTHNPATGIADEDGSVTTYPRVVKVGTDEVIESFAKYSFTLRNGTYMIRNQPYNEPETPEGKRKFVTNYSDFKEKKDGEGVIIAPDTDVLTLTVETQDSW